MSYEQWNSELEETLRKRGVSAKEIDQAREYWYEAYRDRIESGMDEEAAVNDFGSVDAAAASVVESMPTIQRSFCNLRQNHERTALVTVLLVLGAIAWVPVVFAIAMLAVAVYVLLWSLILAAWAFVASGYVFGVSSIIAFILGATSGNWVAGAMDGGGSLAIGGVAVLLTPIAIQVSSILYQASIRFGRWVAHFFVRVAKGDEAGSLSAEPLSFWWSRHPDTFRVFMVVGGIICGAGLALALISLIACGFAPDTVAPLPTVNAGFLGKISYPHLPQSLSFTR